MAALASFGKGGTVGAILFELIPAAIVELVRVENSHAE
jgi:hypothetical protein